MSRMRLRVNPNWQVVAAAAAFAVVVGYLGRPYLSLWWVQIVAFTVLAGAVAVDSFRQMDSPTPFERPDTVLRSRIMHYAQVAKVRNSSALLQTATNPFEASLMRSPNWRELTPDQIRALREPTATAADEPERGKQFI